MECLDERHPKCFSTRTPWLWKTQAKSQWNDWITASHQLYKENKKPVKIPAVLYKLWSIMCYQILVPFRKLNAIVPMIVHFICHSPSNKTGPFGRLLFSALWSQLLSHCRSHGSSGKVCSGVHREKMSLHRALLVFWHWVETQCWKLHLRGDGVQGVDNITWSFSANSNIKCNWTSL